MRKVFSSPRLENVEAVAKMLEDAGIEVRISNDRSYKGKRRQPFSYRETATSENNPQVWVIKAEDQPKARAILREQGLIASTRQGFGQMDASRAPTFLPSSAIAPIARKPDRRATLVMRVRLFLLAIIALLTILTLSGVLHR
ncbi:MAG TPA: pathogenicity-like protein [Xanthomonadaceae bacterium]|jgi:hypothetical protein|nr:pathogenicity-like protein [Xanthomonadaceae bacterium]